MSVVLFPECGIAIQEKILTCFTKCHFFLPLENDLGCLSLELGPE
jgi:hypothetical protein